MKLLLTSNGFTHEVVIAKCEELVGKNGQHPNANALLGPPKNGVPYSGCRLCCNQKTPHT